MALLCDKAITQSVDPWPQFPSVRESNLCDIQPALQLLRGQLCGGLGTTEDAVGALELPRRTDPALLGLVLVLGVGPCASVLWTWGVHPDHGLPLFRESDPYSPWSWSHHGASSGRARFLNARCTLVLLDAKTIWGRTGT